MNIELALFTGVDIPVPELQVNIHQPNIKEISLIGEDSFFIGSQFLCVNKNNFIQDEEVQKKVNNFHILMTLLKEQQSENINLQAHLIAVMTLLFPGYKIMISPQSIILNSEERNVIIDESNFEILQTYFNDIFCQNSGMLGKNGTYNPEGKKAKEIAEKIMRGRKRVAAQKNGSEKGSIFTKYISILTIGTDANSLQDYLNMTMFQLLDLLERFQLYTAWDLDVRSRLAGGHPDKKPDDWMKTLHV